MEIRPSLKIDWKKDVLSESEIKNAAICYSQILRLGLDQNEDNPLNYYFGGLTFLGLNDLNYRTESQSYINFYLCLKNAMKYFGILNNNDNYFDVFHKTLEEYGLLKEDIERLYELGEKTLFDNKTQNKITLEEVASIKIVCDAFFIKNFGNAIKNQRV